RELRAIPAAPPHLLLQQGHSDGITEVLVTPDGEQAFTASRDSTVRVWRLRDRVLLGTLSDHTNGVTSLALGPDGRRLLSGDGMGDINLYGLPRLGVLPRGEGVRHRSGIVTTSFLSDGAKFATLDSGGTVLLWAAAETRLTSAKIADGVTAMTTSGDRIIV